MERIGRSYGGQEIPRWGIALCLGLGACLLAGAVFAWSVASEARAAATESATGTVIGLVESRTRKIGDPPSYAPVVRFEAEGESREIQGSIYSKPASYRVGDPVRVVYPPGKPGDAYIDSWSEVWLVPLILGGLAGAFLLVGVGLGFGRARRVTAESPIAG